MDSFNLSLLIDGIVGQSDNQILNIVLPIGLKVLGGLLLLLVGWVISIRLSAWANAFFETSDLIEETIEQVLVQLIRFGVLTVAVVLVLQLFGVQAATILACSAAWRWPSVWRCRGLQQRRSRGHAARAAADQDR